MSALCRVTPSLTWLQPLCRFWKRIGPTVHSKDVEARVAQRPEVTPGAAPLDSVTLPSKGNTLSTGY